MRQVFSDFAVIIAILSMTSLDFYVGINTPKLEVNIYKSRLVIWRELVGVHEVFTVKPQGLKKLCVLV